MNGKVKVAIVIVTILVALTVWHMTIEHEVDVTHDGEGTVSPYGAIVGHRESLDLEMVPEEGWCVGKVTVNGDEVQCDGNILTLDDIIRDQDVHVTFVPTGEYRILTVEHGDGGIITPDGVTYHPVSDVVRVAITPTTGKVVGSIILDGAPIAPVNILDVTMDTDHVLEVTFRDVTDSDPVVTIDVDVDVRIILPERTLGADVYDFGTVYPVGDVIVPYGGSLTVVIELNPGYEVEHSIINGVDHGHDSTFTIDDITHSFDIDIGIMKLVEADHVVTLTAGKGGSVTPSGRVGVMSGDSLTFTVRADSGYRTSKVTVDD